jgi:hypothetical protein
VTVTSPPTSPIGNLVARIVEIGEARITMLFDKQADLRDSGMNFTRFGAATTVQKIIETRPRSLVCTENSNPDVVLVKPAEDRV